MEVHGETAQSEALLKLDLDETQLEELECPFTWDMGICSHNLQYYYSLKCNEDFTYPLYRLMSRIMCTYDELKKQEMNTKMIEMYLRRCERSIFHLEENADPEISIDVAKYILEGNKYYVYKKLKEDAKMKQAVDNIKNFKFNSAQDKSTLLICKSICWTIYGKNNKGIMYIRQAISANPNCHVGYYILAKHLRQQRRVSSHRSKPSEEEMSLILKAYELSQSQLYECFVAQMYRENYEREKAEDLYEKIYNDKPEHFQLSLKLALGFIELGNLEKAKTCLDRVAVKHRTNSTFLHYCGTYYMKAGRCDIAKEYFEKAIAVKNFAATNQYIECILKMDKNLDIASFLSELLDKYGTNSHHFQSVILDLAFYYWKKENDMNKALECFYRAMEINPTARCMKNYLSTFFALNLQSKNVFEMLADDFLPRINFRRTKYNQVEILKADKLQARCDDYFKL